MVSPNSPLGPIRDAFEREYDDAVVYADRESEDVLHEGPVRIGANGWVELPSGRLISPSAVHHVDERP
ncbi:hypothetical protein [Halarchaeum nitratireducens]|uniref:Uncharacterized protein n=1 Tax=Halarchaeum nitratireducens TaxID=489913 RepID=A0A830G794_9EURY|nr:MULTISPECIES: hypothetical protein [Halarchaeum]MBP2252043.1 hypothetical protein [Halarchaeum solikamskense]GGN05194.1 hypothetical protein GCM10009021_00050 [Halarchaeum nitratireducens]